MSKTSADSQPVAEDTAVGSAPVVVAAAVGGRGEDHRVIRVEIIISTLLRVGVRLSLSIVVIGLILSFVRHPEYRGSRQEFKTLTAYPADFPHSLPDVWSGLAHWRGPSIVMLGLLLLIATPVMRVAVSILAFVYQHDLTFVVITTVVLLLLLLSFILGGLHE